MAAHAYELGFRTLRAPGRPGSGGGVATSGGSAKPGHVVGVAEREQRSAQLFDSVEGPHPKQVLLERANEALGAAVPLQRIPFAYGVSHSTVVRRTGADRVVGRADEGGNELTSLQTSAHLDPQRIKNLRFVTDIF